MSTQGLHVALTLDVDRQRVGVDGWDVSESEAQRKALEKRPGRPVFVQQCYGEVGDFKTRFFKFLSTHLVPVAQHEAIFRETVARIARQLQAMNQGGDGE